MKTSHGVGNPLAPLPHTLTHTVLANYSSAVYEVDTVYSQMEGEGVSRRWGGVFDVLKVELRGGGIVQVGLF